MLTRFLHPGLTSVEQDVGRIAREAVEILLRRIEEGPSVSGPHEMRRVPARLVIRDFGLTGCGEFAVVKYITANNC